MNVVINNDKGRVVIVSVDEVVDMLVASKKENARLLEVLDDIVLEIKRAKNTYSLEELFKHLEAAQALAEKELKNKDTI